MAATSTSIGVSLANYMHPSQGEEGSGHTVPNKLSLRNAKYRTAQLDNMVLTSVKHIVLLMTMDTISLVTASFCLGDNSMVWLVRLNWYLNDT